MRRGRGGEHAGSGLGVKQGCWVSALYLAAAAAAVALPPVPGAGMPAASPNGCTAYWVVER
eukprot:scaffold186339_cov14-Tisochrysis_lutea.AAC.1